MADLGGDAAADEVRRLIGSQQGEDTFQMGHWLSYNILTIKIRLEYELPVVVFFFFSSLASVFPAPTRLKASETGS